jgi:hypothetical protein
VKGEGIRITTLIALVALATPGSTVLAQEFPR